MRRTAWWKKSSQRDSGGLDRAYINRAIFSGREENRDRRVRREYPDRRAKRGSPVRKALKA